MRKVQSQANGEKQSNYPTPRVIIFFSTAKFSSASDKALGKHVDFLSIVPPMQFIGVVLLLDHFTMLHCSHKDGHVTMHIDLMW
jgi:hypothetical protein